MLKLKSSLILGSFSLLSLAVLTNSGCVSSDKSSSDEPNNSSQTPVVQEEVINAPVLVEETVTVTEAPAPVVVTTSLLDVVSAAINKNFDSELATFNANATAETLASLIEELNAKEEFDFATAKELSDLAIILYAVNNYGDAGSADSAKIALRIKENIALKSALLYLDVAKSLKKKEVITNLVNECQNRYELIAKLQKSRQITPFVADIEKDRTQKLEQALSDATAEYEANLAALVAYAPITSTNIDTKVLDLRIVNKKFSIDSLYKLALLERAELANLNDINMMKYDEFKKLVKADISIKDSITALVNGEFSTTQYKKYFTPEQVELEKRLPIVNNVIANITYFNKLMTEKKDDFVKYDKAFAAAEKKLSNATSSTKNKGDLAKLELDEIRFTASDLEIKKLNALTEYFQAYIYLLNGVGIEDIIDTMPLDILKDTNAQYNDIVATFTKDDNADDKKVEKSGNPTIRFTEIDLINSAE